MLQSSARLVAPEQSSDGQWVSIWVERRDPGCNEPPIGIDNFDATPPRQDRFRSVDVPFDRDEGQVIEDLAESCDLRRKSTKIIAVALDLEAIESGVNASQVDSGRSMEDTHLGDQMRVATDITKPRHQRGSNPVRVIKQAQRELPWGDWWASPTHRSSVRSQRGTGDRRSYERAGRVSPGLSGDLLGGAALFLAKTLAPNRLDALDQATSDAYNGRTIAYPAEADANARIEALLTERPTLAIPRLCHNA